MTDGHCFISYSSADGLEFATKLANELEGGYPFINVWFDKRDLRPGMDWDVQIDEALKACNLMLFVMTVDSTNEKSVCKQELSRALSYKKPIVPIFLHPNSQSPFRLGDRQRIDFTSNFEAGLGQLRRHIAWMASPEGQLQALKDRLLDAERDLQRSRPENQPRVQADIDDLKKQIETQEKIVANPQAAEEQTKKNIEAGLERERKPEKPTVAETTTKFINPPPGVAPPYFQDRYFETEQIADFLKDPAQRLMTIIGRAGIGKTATICRLLKDLERGVLPDELGEMQVDGIVYLSEAGSHKINFANIFYDLCKLLSSEAAQKLDAIYKNPQASTESKVHVLLDHFNGERVVLLLDNFEPLINAEQENLPIQDAELDEALRTFLNGTHTALNVIITTRIPPKAVNSIQLGRQRIYHLEAGLEPKYAVEMLRQMDKDGTLGVKDASEDLLMLAYERTRGFPKAIEALHQILASDRYTTLDELLAMPLPENVVEALVGEAFNRLDTNAQKVMQALAVYNRPVTPAAVDYLLAPHIPAMDSAPILQRLANMHFARKESGRFYLHPVDREFAFGLIPQGETRDWRLEISDSDESQETDDQSPISNYQLPFTQHDLTLRAADYFAAARKPRAEWKKLEDLSAQLAEFDLRCAAGDYDTAASVLLEIDFDCLFQWGHHHLMIELHMKSLEEIQDKTLAMLCNGRLGLACRAIGFIHEFIRYEEKALKTAQEAKDQNNEAAWLGNLGLAYADLGDVHKAIEFNEKALVIDREIDDLNGQSLRLGNLGGMNFSLGNANKAYDYFEKALSIASEIGARHQEIYMLISAGDVQSFLAKNQKAKECYLQAIKIADEISLPYAQLGSRCGLAEVYLHQNDLVNARATIEAALQCNVLENNYNATILHGIIALRQGDVVTARGAFVRAIGQADEILSKTAEYYTALDAKGLASCGLALCRDDLHGHPGAGIGAGIGASPILTDAIDAFRKARKIAPHAGIVKATLRLFDELMKCEGGEMLKDVRKAAEGAKDP